ncbi:hypothetical protein ACFYMO_28250 [Streptomyces sp. NPDC007025]|uniref:hypothetical protein n=1 Tax=Streptomyces sp. NPDC007025 TaxID=3364771 RepID=UPI003687E994
MRTERLNRGLLWGAGIAAVVLVALTLGAFLTGDDGGGEKDKESKGGGKSPSASASPDPTYTTPEDWTEPKRWITLPPGKEKDSRGNPVKFPHTTEGALAVILEATSASVEGERSLADEQLDDFRSYEVRDEQTPANLRKVKEHAAQTDQKMRASLDLADGEPLPSGVWFRSHPVGFKVVSESKSEVVVWVTSRVTRKGGETEEEQSSRARALSAVEWEDGDWKVSAAAINRAAQDDPAKPEIAAPGDALFNEEGWTAIREAS